MQVIFFCQESLNERRRRLSAKGGWLMMIRGLRAGWGLTSERIGKNPEGLNLPALLDRSGSRKW
jgi:hypothetical protein